MKKLISIICVLALVSCTWVKDDIDDCPYGFWLKLQYSYNILDVEAAPKYVTDAYVYIYDADGNFVKRIFVTRDELAAENYLVKVDGLPEGDYQFVVLSGADNFEYVVSNFLESIQNFRFGLSRTSTSSEELSPLFQGYLPTVHYDENYAVHVVELIKTTNQLACIVVPVTGRTDVAFDDYTMKLVAANSEMDAYGNETSDFKVTYEPYNSELVTFNDAEYGTLRGIKFGISTLRLMQTDDVRIILEKKSTGQSIFNLSLPEYFGMIGSYYTNLGRKLSVQEYLDRQDFYTIVFYLSDDFDQLLQLEVNTWRLRANNHLKL